MCLCFQHSVPISSFHVSSKTPRTCIELPASSGEAICDVVLFKVCWCIWMYFKLNFQQFKLSHEFFNRIYFNLIDDHIVIIFVSLVIFFDWCVSFSFFLPNFGLCCRVCGRHCALLVSQHVILSDMVTYFEVFFRFNFCLFCVLVYLLTK